MHTSRCTILTSDGRRCSSFVYPGHATLCHQHLRQELESAPPPEDIAADLFDSIQNFQSATSINAALGKILAMLAAGRIKRKDALSMAYICQLLLQSLKGFKHEILLTTYEKIWERDLIKVLNARTPLQDFAFPPPLEEEPETPETPQSPEPPHSNSQPAAHQPPTQQSSAPPPDENPHSIPAQEIASNESLADTEAAEEENPQQGNHYNYWEELRQQEQRNREQRKQAPQKNYNEAKEEPQLEKVQT
jgi:hypothetical protein